MSFKKWFGRNDDPATHTPETPHIREDGHAPAAGSSELQPRRLLTKTTPRVEAAHFGTELTSPVDRDRLVAYLSAEDYKFSIDDDGDVVGVWDGHPFWFMFMGPDKRFFQIRARWRRKISTESKLMLMQVANDWNRDKLGPKVFVREDEETHEHSIFAEITFDYSSGASKKQFEYSVDYALKSSLQFFEFLNTTISPLQDEESPEN
ncbi:YbjN domain-containing protein [Timonella sp. A28]|uniref:YbjN domain-containing protein n=1 Tax=Timonella sp. A28 TaxID=3442640 RepID=UPI003EC12A3B